MIREFKQQDWYAIIDPIEEDAIGISPAMALLAERGVAITVADSEGVIGCGGVVLYDENNGEIWVRLSKRVCRTQALRSVLAGLAVLRPSFKDVTLFCRVKEGFTKAIKMVEWLGFQFDRVQDGYLVYRI